MTQEIVLQEEGNSVDPPDLQPLSRPFPPGQGGAYVNHGPSGGQNGEVSSDMNTREKFVFESSRTSSRACVETFVDVDGVKKMKSFVLDRDAHTTSISAAGAVTPLNESNSASASRGLADTYGKQIELLAKDTFSDLQITQRPNGESFKETKDRLASLTTIDKNVTDVALNLEQNDSTPNNPNENQRMDVHTEQSKQEQPSAAFSYEQAKLAYRLKPHLTSDFLSQEMHLTSNESKTTTNNYIDEILRKYGLETKKYDPPIAFTKPANEDTFGTASTTSFSSYKSYSCQRVSVTHCNSAHTDNHADMSYPPVSPLRHMDLSQNNEALSKLADCTVKQNTAETSNPDIAQEPPAPLQAPICNKEKENSPKSQNLAIIGNLEENQETSTSVDIIADGDSSKNNDTQEKVTYEEKKSLITQDVSTSHGSSVDIAVSGHNEGIAEHMHAMPMSYGGSYSGLRGTTSVTTYTSPYGRTSVSPGMRAGSFVMSSRPSNMDIGPFEGSYLKHHLTKTRYPSTLGVGLGTTDTVTSGPSSSGNSRDSLTSNGSSLTLIGNLGSPTDSLDYSLQQERYRLRGIDNLIASGPGFTSRSYSTMPYMSIHTPKNSSMAFSHRSSMSNWGKTLSNTGSYDNPTDVATIRKDGSNVDTGQFNNNRAFADYGYRSNRYGSEMAERLGVQEAWIQESDRKERKQKSYKTHPQQKHQQQQRQKQELKRQTSAWDTSSSIVENAVQRNRSAINQNTVPSSKAAPVARDKVNSQRPKSALARSCSNKGANSASQTKKSHIVSDTSEFSTEFKRITNLSDTEKNNPKYKIKASNASKPSRYKNNCNVGRGRSGQDEGNGEERKEQIGHLMHDVSTPNTRQLRACKYRPYGVKPKEKEEKQPCQSQEQVIEDHQTESANLLALSSSSSKVSRSQGSCQDAESEFQHALRNLHPFSSYGTCRPCLDASQRDIVTATALASALIHKRQHQVDRLQKFLPNSYSHMDAKATEGSSKSTSDSPSKGIRPGAKKPLKKTKSANGRSPLTSLYDDYDSSVKPMSQKKSKLWRCL